ncbi:MotA/TolQ/ExbB proton channel family protein [Paraburkholderia bannensis]|uniref:MotA/TolQ/ExbB proton channel family protein n=1 Tax=Paraburkholderia bannensis TaxID=765414 RepID=UPI002AB71C4D|nr:MotA/TolQ/ExbB proton channel family protein [Paraburkholderia bannensis]
MAASNGVIHYLQTSDAVTHAVAWVLLAMSVASWCFLIVKSWVLVRAKRQGPRAVTQFWQAATLADGVSSMRALDRERVFLPLAQAALAVIETDTAGALLARVDRGERVLRALRGALQASQRRLEFGQVLLASVGSTAPFVGLLGTVWGIYHALGSIAASGQAMIENVAGPVGEALIMTAFGLVVAIPAVLAYNILGRLARQIGDDLDGFAHDLHAWASAPEEAATRREGAAPRELQQPARSEGVTRAGAL